MTDRADDVASNASSTANNQHHQGIDWIYGGWDRDVLQGEQSANGPNLGDRLIRRGDPGHVGVRRARGGQQQRRQGSRDR